MEGQWVDCPFAADPAANLSDHWNNAQTVVCGLDGDESIRKQPIERLKTVYPDGTVITRGRLWNGKTGTVSSQR
ncbi:hypothetical protein ACFPMF_08510 [Larkinella bovis]|uniref:Uncharacterized protein n=1 Tax=Larkinella bovis TaxID=683041 RepID=A0ABW0I7U4_9BACT